MFHDEVSGIEVLSSPTETDDVVSLRFRVGQADETLAERGYCHLAEHLALGEVVDAPYPFNGMTGQTVTSFEAVTSPPKQAAFLNSVIDRFAAIADGSLSAEHILHEAEILEAEAAQRASGVIDQVAGRLFGADTYGLFGWSEFGLRDLDVDRFRAWTTKWFSRRNAIIAFHNKIPDGLSFAAMREGERMLAPIPQPILADLPAFQPAHGPVGLFAAVPRADGSLPLAAILQKRITNSLRHEMAASYAPWFDYAPVSKDWALVAAAADVKPESETAAVRAIVSEIARLAEAGPSTDEIDFQRAVWEEQQGRSSLAAGRLEWSAEELLHGAEIQSEEQIRRQWEDLTPAMVQNSAEVLRRSYLLSAPPEAELADVDVRALPEWTNELPPPGKRYDFDQHNGSIGPYGVPYLLLSDDAISLVNQNVRTLTIRREDAQILLTWGDGVHQLIGRHGQAIAIMPNRWKLFDEVVGSLNGWMAPSQIKKMGFRGVDPDAHPLPVKSVAGLNQSANFESMVHVVDGVGWHFQDQSFGDTRPPVQAFVRGGLMLGWLADRKLLSEWVEDAAAEPLALYRAGELSRARLYEEVDGLLATDMVVVEAKRFLVWLYAPGKTKPSRVHAVLLGLEAGLANIYDLPDSGQIPTRFDDAVDAQLRKFSQSMITNSHKLKKMVARNTA